MNIYLTRNELREAVIDYAEKMVGKEYTGIGPICVHQGGDMKSAESLEGDDPIVWIDDIEFDLDTRADK